MAATSERRPSYQGDFRFRSNGLDKQTGMKKTSILHSIQRFESFPPILFDDFFKESLISPTVFACSPLENTNSGIDFSIDLVRGESAQSSQSRPVFAY